jgi:mannose-6-phosphate isomerase-like protein (cupin superfamily)
MQRIEKPWGYEEWLEVNSNYVVKRLFMKKGNSCSLQFHDVKKETIIVIDGILTLIHNGRTVHMKPCDVITISPKEVHRMSAEKEDCLYLECSTPELDDVIRVEDKYGRK